MKKIIFLTTLLVGFSFNANASTDKAFGLDKLISAISASFVVPKPRPPEW